MIQIMYREFDEEEIDWVYEEIVMPKVAKAIQEFWDDKNQWATHAKPYIQDAYRITAAFLRKYRFDTADVNLLKNEIKLYLTGGKVSPQAYLERIILSFWRCAADVCGSVVNLADGEVEALIRWPRIKAEALRQSSPEKRRDKILSAVNEKTCALFSGAAPADIAAWRSDAGTLTEDGISAIDFIPALTDALHGVEEPKKRKGKGNNGAAAGGQKPADQTPKGALGMLEGIFSYDFMGAKRKKKTARHWLLSAMEVPVCPYCNRQYITVYSEKDSGSGQGGADGGKTTADLDHFYIKSEYPYLALSLYNFIPSCQICNSRFKGFKDFFVYPHIYPYAEKSDEDVVFTLAPNADLMDYRQDLNGRIELSNPSGDEAAANSIETFRLKEVYQSHANYVQELLFKHKVYQKDRITALKNEFGSLLGDEYSIRTLIYGRYLEQSEYIQRPLAKLTRDILEMCYQDDPIDWE